MKLLELYKVIRLEAILKAKENKEQIFVAWDKGKISPITGSPTNQEDLEMYASMSSIKLRLDFAKNVINFNPMDDRSDFRFIKKLQQAVGDLIKAKIIDESWKLNIHDVNKNLGGGSIKKLMAYDANFDKVIPICFHGTTDLYLDTIQRFGVMPPNELEKMGYDLAQQHEKFYTEESTDNVYLTIDYTQAEYYARNAAEHSGGKPIIITFKDLDVSKVDADDDIINNVGFAQLILKLSGQGSDYNTYIDGIRANSQLSYKGRIPANKISRITKVR